MSWLGRVRRDPRIQRAMYQSRALDLWHRRRNRGRLTVAMFHRVLARTDRRWQTADPEYSMPADVFAGCLEFFRKHYDVVSVDDIVAARRGVRRLPELPLLITFDDGWADNEEYALPLLRAARLPALIFIASDALDRRAPFWQESLIGAWRGRRIGEAELAATWRELGVARRNGDGDALAPVRALIAAMEEAEPAARRRILERLAPSLDDGERHMMTTEQLRRVAAAGVAIGGHGQTHEPLTRVDAAAELRTCKRVLDEKLAGLTTVTTMSFPHGDCDERTARAALDCGYEVLFGSVSELPAISLAGDGAAGVINRCGVMNDAITGPDGQFAAERAALNLFRKPHYKQRGRRRDGATAPDVSVTPR